MKRQSPENTNVLPCEKRVAVSPSRVELENHNVQHEAPDNSWQFLPNEIIEEILDRLPSNDLIPISLTCKSLKHLVEEYFRRRRKFDGKVSIRAHHDVEFDITPENAQRFEKRFRSFIQCIEILIYQSSYDANNILQFIRENCAKKIRWLEFISIFDIPLGRGVAAISEQIKYLDVLILDGVYISIKTIVKLMPNLRVLWIEGCSTKMVPITTKLEILIFNDFDADQQISEFLHHNPQLRTVACRNTNAINDVLSFTKPLPLATIWIQNETIFDEIIDSLNKCDQQKHLKALDAVFIQDTYVIAPVINGIRCMKGLHFSLNEDSILFLDIVNPHIERLCIYVVNSTIKRMYKRFIECSQNVNVPRVKMHLFQSPKKILMHLIELILRKFNKLKHLYINWPKSSKLTLDNVMRLRMVRQDSNNFTPVTVHLREDNFTQPDLIDQGYGRNTFKIHETLCPICKYGSSSNEMISYLDRMLAIYD